MTILNTRYIPTGYVKLPQPDICVKLGLEVYVSSDDSNKPAAIGYHGKSNKPDFHYVYRDNAHREEAIAKWLTSWVQHHERKEAQRAKKKAFKHTVAVGDVFRCSWGYDQTNVDYYEVIEVKGKHVTVIEIKQTRIHDGPDYGTCAPFKGAFVEGAVPQKKLIQGDENYQYFRVNSFSTATKIDPKEVSYWSSYA